MGQERDALVEIMTAPNEPVARMWVDVLRDEGIPAMIKPLGPGIGAWGSASNLEHALYVREADAARGRDVIEGFELAPFEEVEGDPTLPDGDQNA